MILSFIQRAICLIYSWKLRISDWNSKVMRSILIRPEILRRTYPIFRLSHWNFNSPLVIPISHRWNQSMSHRQNRESYKSYRQQNKEQYRQHNQEETVQLSSCYRFRNPRLLFPRLLFHYYWKKNKGESILYSLHVFLVVAWAFRQFVLRPRYRAMDLENGNDIKFFLKISYHIRWFLVKFFWPKSCASKSHLWISSCSIAYATIKSIEPVPYFASNVWVPPIIIVWLPNTIVLWRLRPCFRVATCRHLSSLYSATIFPVSWPPIIKTASSVEVVE